MLSFGSQNDASTIRTYCALEIFRLFSFFSFFRLLTLRCCVWQCINIFSIVVNSWYNLLLFRYIALLGPFRDGNVYTKSSFSLRNMEPVPTETRQRATYASYESSYATVLSTNVTGLPEHSPATPSLPLYRNVDREKKRWPMRVARGQKTREEPFVISIVVPYALTFFKRFIVNYFSHYTNNVTRRKEFYNVSRIIILSKFEPRSIEFASKAQFPYFQIFHSHESKSTSDVHRI